MLPHTYTNQSSATGFAKHQDSAIASDNEEIAEVEINAGEAPPPPLRRSSSLFSLSSKKIYLNPRRKNISNSLMMKDISV